MTTASSAFACPSGHPRSRPFRNSDGCKHCRAESMVADIVSVLVAAVPSLDEELARVVVDEAAGSGLPRQHLRDWLARGPEVVHSGASDCPSAAVRLLWTLDARGFAVGVPACLDCRARRPLPAVVDGGRVCMNCYQRRRAEACGRCGIVKIVMTRDPDGGAVCLQCRNADPANWRPCDRCGTTAQTVAVEGGMVVGTCCYVPPQLRCTVCHIRKGAREWRTRRPVCGECAELERTPCAVCGLEAAAPADDAEAICARCRTKAPTPCTRCGVLTIGRSRQGDPRCFDCYSRPVSSCGRCGRIRSIVRLATDGEPDLCAVCWKGPVMACEECGRVRPCRGERKGRMLCIQCRPVRPQRCAHCGNSRKPMAHWPEGPVCATCYYAALAAKGDCPSCGDRRRLRRFPGFDEALCADCAGEPATHVCQECGIEDCLYERGVCPRCTLRKRLTAMLGDEEARRRNGTAPLFEALAAAEEPRATLDWLLKSRKAVEALSRIGRGELPLSYQTIDALEPTLGVHTARHLETLLASSGALPGRDPVLAATERWCERFLESIEHKEHGPLLRRWWRWQVRRNLEKRAEASPLFETTGHAARRRLREVDEFCRFLADRGRRLNDCRQADIDAWVASRPIGQLRLVSGFCRWAMDRKAMPRLDVPSGRGTPMPPPMGHDDRWDIARRLLHGDGIDPADRVAGALAVIYAQPLFKISRLTTGDFIDTDDRLVVVLGGPAIDLPEPLASHGRALLGGRRQTPRKASLDDPGWLFPGNVPGRPITTQGLSRRLAGHGVRAQHHRLTALYQLAAEIPAPLLADLLGISPASAETWSRLANRSWVDYPAMRQATAGPS